jgi:phosphohistidine phosphatase
VIAKAATTRFYLVRHAQAEAKTSSDAARRLTPEGRAGFAAHARALAPRLSVARIVTSPFARARETADLLAAAIGVAVEEDGALASGASAGEDLLALGRRLGAGAALVGHNPEFAEAIALAAGRAVDVRPGAVAAIDAGPDGLRLAWLEACPEPVERAP